MNDFQKEYDSLSALRIRKHEIEQECKKDEERMRELWADLFQEEQPDNMSDRISFMVKTGIGAFDGVMLCWKLYKKYGNIFRKWKKK